MSKILNKPLRVVLGTNILSLIAPALLAPFYAIYVERVGGDILDAGIASSVFALVAGLTIMLAGRYSDRIERKEIIVATGYVITGLGYIGYLFVNSMTALLLVQVVIGLSQAFYAPAFDGLYTQNIGDERRISSRWGIWEASNYFSIALGAFLGGLIVKYAGFNSLFVIMAILCLLSGVYLLSTPKKVFQE